MGYIPLNSNVEKDLREGREGKGLSCVYELSITGVIGLPPGQGSVSFPDGLVEDGSPLPFS